ncbi:hypothetical protein BaRGS_00020076 [Batillaria attramentaria]|uniref:Profilin n=1 Tax=Batillaria attramentaria TaxID=370345 RepID=A0ABD0KNZ7_9CAEN
MRRFQSAARQDTGGEATLPTVVNQESAKARGWYESNAAMRADDKTEVFTGRRWMCELNGRTFGQRLMSSGVSTGRSELSVRPGGDKLNREFRNVVYVFNSVRRTAGSVVLVVAATMQAPEIASTEKHLTEVIANVSWSAQ